MLTGECPPCFYGDLTGECPPCFYGDLTGECPPYGDRRVSAMLLW